MAMFVAFLPFTLCNKCETLKHAQFWFTVYDDLYEVCQ